jgi:DNA-binding transcriptional regulator YiaG
MPNIVAVFKDEIRRIARKEIKAAFGKTQQSAAVCRKEILQLKRRIDDQAKLIALLKKQIQNGQDRPPTEEDPLDSVRFSSRSVRAQRKRLNLSAADYGKLVGVSALTIYHWESGKSRPRKAQFAALTAVRGIGKREALKRIESLADQSQQT